MDFAWIVLFAGAGIAAILIVRSRRNRKGGGRDNKHTPDARD